MGYWTDHADIDLMRSRDICFGYLNSLHIMPNRSFNSLFNFPLSGSRILDVGLLSASWRLSDQTSEFRSRLGSQAVIALKVLFDRARQTVYGAFIDTRYFNGVAVTATDPAGLDPSTVRHIYRRQVNNPHDVPCQHAGEEQHGPVDEFAVPGGERAICEEELLRDEGCEEGDDAGDAVTGGEGRGVVEGSDNDGEGFD